MLKLDKEIEKHSKEIVLLKNKANKTIIKNDADTVKATEFLIFLKKKLKTYEDERLTYTAPLNISLKAINKKFKEIMTPLKEAEQLIKTGILEYRQIQEEKRLELEKKMQKKNGDVEIKTLPTEIESKSGKIRARKIWEFEIIDEKKITRNYLKIDETKIREDINSGIRNIPGVRIYEEENLSVYQ